MIARIVSGAVFGAVIGYERDRHGRPGRFAHTPFGCALHVGSATFMVVSSQFAYYQHFAQGEGIEVDASRIAALESVAATAVGITAPSGFALLRRLEDKDDHVASRRVTVVLGDEGHGTESDSMTRIMDIVSELGATVRDVEYSRRLDTKKRTTLTFDVKLPLRVTMGELVDTIERHPGVKRVSVVFSR